ncbi:MAG: hypothetical protein JSW52_09950 [Candidatus Coatesbacteria bacterium]|nr:MAG: hypothetical protein JSW52_09950 [Candidatus Coatesbacteria bacterium]
MCYANSEEGTDAPAEGTAGAVTNVSEETSTDEEPGEPLSEYAFLLMEYLRSMGYPVYDKNIFFCSAVIEPFGPEYIILGTGDEKDEVVSFYVAAGGTLEYYESGTATYRVWGGPTDVETHDEDDGLNYDEEEVVLFRDWEMPVGVLASRDGKGTEVIYDFLGDVFSVE